MVRRFIFPVLFLVPVLLHPVAAATSPIAGTLFWEYEIETALSLRNEVFGTLIPASADINMTAWNSIVRQTAESALFNDETRTTAWDSFIRGMLLSLKGDRAAADHLVQSLFAAENDPGTTWLLFVEFDRYNLIQWTDRALMQLEKQLFAAGGVSAKIIAGQLTQLGFVNTRNRDMDKAVYHFTWAHRFNAHEMTSMLQRARTASPLQFITVMKAVAEIFPVLCSSWRAQVDFFNFWYTFIRRAAFFFIIAIATMLCIKYSPAALHRFSHYYPITVNVPLRTFLACGVAVSFISFGLLPFLWLCAFLLWRFFSRTERLLFGFVVAGVVLSPLDTALMDRLYRSVNPVGPVMQMSRSINEGSVSSAASSSTVLDDASSRNRAVQLSSALNALKNLDLAKADSLIKRLSGAYPADPVVADVQGIIYFLSGAIDSAALCFRNVVQQYPTDIAARFNLSQCLMASNDATSGMDLLKTATQLQPQLITRFLQDNDRYYSNRWPPLRQVLFPDYSPLQFWKWFFLPSAGPDSLWRSLWGLSFLGIPPGVSFILFILLVAALFVVQERNRNKPKLRRLFECKYCGRTICRQCAVGILCASCANQTQSLKGGMTLEQCRESIAAKSQHLIALRNALLNVLFPGSGGLLEIKPRYFTATVTVAAASIVYAWWYQICIGRSFTWLSPVELIYLFSIPSLFSAYYFIKYLPPGIHHFRSLLHPRYVKERGIDGTQRDAA